MNKHKKHLLILATFSPLMAFANGIGDSLDWMGLQIFVVLAFIVFLILAKVSLRRKVILVVIFIAAEYLSAALTVGLPYANNLLLLQIISLVIPIFTTVVAYWILKAKLRK